MIVSASSLADGRRTTAAPKIEVGDLTKDFPGRPAPLGVLDGISFHVEAGEFVAILGPSGCGKSTLLGILAGIESPGAGTVRVDGEPLSSRSTPFALMPQKDALLPWRRIVDNAALGVELQGVRRARARERVRPLFPVFGLEGFEHHFPAQLSGGMRQRAALLRTVAQDRSVLLLDEPFGSLDAITRTEMQQWLASMWQTFRWTVVLITHDVREAVYLADRVYVLTPRPARVARVVDVGLPRPRRLSSVGDPEFARVEVELLNALANGDMPLAHEHREEAGVAVFPSSHRGAVA